MPRTGRSASTALAAVLVVATWLSACGASPGHPPSASPRGAATPSLSGTSPSPGATPSPALTASWPEYHHDAQRTGRSATTPDVSTLSNWWTANLDGAVWAEPLVVGDNAIVVTENDTLYALDPENGAVVWKDHVGTPVPESALPCGDIFPLGMTGTPAYDPSTQSIFVVAEETGPIHVLYAFDAATGAVRWSRQVDISLPSEDAAAVQQRTALLVANGYVYFGFGGLDGDCGQYRGAVVAVATNGQGSTLTYVVPTTREGAVWSPGGPVLGSGGEIFVSTGNGAAVGETWDDTDSVLEFTPSLQLVSAFAPSRWAYDNSHDLDLGSVAPTLLPDGYVFIAGKSGIGYVLQQSSLGGVGGQVSTGPVCQGAMAFGGTAFSGDTVYLPCASGVQAISVAASGSFTSLWQTSSGANGPPVLGGASVFCVDTSSGTLLALDAVTGALQGQISVGPVPHFATPALDGGLALVPTLSGVVAISGI